MRLLLLVPLCIMIASAYAGACPKYPIIRDFDFQRYMGLWYQQDKLQSGWEMPGRCWKTLYSRDRKNGMFKMKMIYSSTVTGRMEEYDSQLTLGTLKKPSMIKYSIPLTFMEDEFQILATDYESFAIEYKCDPNGFFEKTESIFLNTREKNPSPLVLQRAYAIMHRLGVDIRKLERVDQTCGGLNLNGPEYPDYDDYYTNEVPDNRRHYQNPVNYEYYDYAASGAAPVGESVDVDPSPPSNQQGWVPVQGSPNVKHQTAYRDEDAGGSGHASAPQYVEMQKVEHQPQYQPVEHQPQYQPVERTRVEEHQPQYHHPQKLMQPNPKINLRPANNRRNSGGNRRHQGLGPADERISLGQNLATKLWRVLHQPVSK